MSENNEPSCEDDVSASMPTRITQEPGWESLEDEQPSIGQPGARARSVIELRDEGCARPGRRARRAVGEPASTGRRAERAGLAALATAVLAGCLAVAIALLSTGAPERPNTAHSPSAKPCSAPMLPRSRHEDDRRPPRQAKTPAAQLSPIRAGSASNPAAPPQAPETRTGASAASPPPAEHADAGQTGGGPFSP
jgi:hypothetical protein